MKHITIRIDEKLWKKLRAKLLKEETTVTGWLTNLVKEFVK